LQNMPIYRGSLKARIYILEDRLQKVVFLRRSCDTTYRSSRKDSIAMSVIY